MVDTAFRKAVRVEVVERAVDSIAEVGLLVRVAQHPFAHKSIIRLVGLVDIEVSRQDGRKLFAFAKFFHLVLYEERTFHACFLADMVHVQVEEKEFEAGIFAFEVSPTANTRQHGIPSFARHVGSFRQTKITFLYHVKLVCAIENSRMFTFLFAVVATYTDIIITG